MASISFNPVYSFIEALAEKVHDLGSDTLKIMLSNTAPSLSSTQYSDITQIASGNGYTTGGQEVTVYTSSQTSGVYTLVCAGTITWTATGGNMATFRYLWLYNDTASNKELLGYYDSGSALTLQEDDSYNVNCGATLLTIQAAS